MPSNIFASTGTNVSIVFLDKTNTNGKIVLLDASKLGETIKEDKNQKTVLTATEEQLIVDTFNNREAVEELSVTVTYDEITEKNYSFSAGQYFEVKIDYVDITADEFDLRMNAFAENLNLLFTESKGLEMEIESSLQDLKYV
jgi:type I restriction enzyme M protein